MKIIHIDMDAFYAAVEQRDNPALRGKPVIVGGSPESRGVVSTASYEARRFGVHSAMASAQAKRLCPQGIFLPPNFEKYEKASQTIHSIFRKYTSRIEPVSLDEAYLDVTRNILKLDDPAELARLIKQHIKAATGLTASAGVAPNKFLAKVASDFKKPDGLTVVLPDKAQEFLSPLSVRKIPGVGPVTEKRLYGLGIFTCRDLLDQSLEKLARHFGKFGAELYEMARGIDESPVVTGWISKQIGSEETFEADLLDLRVMERELGRIAEEVAARLVSEKRAGKTVTLKVKYSDFSTITRSLTLPRPTGGEEEIRLEAIRMLREKTEAGRRPVRLLGISVSNFDRVRPGSSQLELFPA
ncbi:MAG: DNA polymerase IV [Candidatus Omnitrophica bacterium]|nr:DNA polymerase IV [Candidatus Omnitrophota bacterium]